MTPFRVYMGYDYREQGAYAVAKSSIMRRTSKPEETIVLPLELGHLMGAYELHIHNPDGSSSFREHPDLIPSYPFLTRPIEAYKGDKLVGWREGDRLWCPISQAPMSTEFAISRFGVPFLAKAGWALFVDCDIVCLADITKLFALADERYAVMVVKHDHRPKKPDELVAHIGGKVVESVVLEHEETKMGGQIQTFYPRKNWSSVVLWNCSHPSHRNLTLEALNTWPGRDLHAFKWLKDEEIGELPSWWNFLVGVQDPHIHDPVSCSDGTHTPGIQLMHFTLGGPWISGWKGGPMDDVWLKERGYLEPCSA